MHQGTRFFSVKHLRIAFILCLSIAAAAAQAQQLLPKNQPKYDRKTLHFGFSLGFNYYDFHIQKIEDLAALDGYYAVRSEMTPGYTIRIISNLRLADHWDLRFNPGFAATERSLHFDVINPISGLREEITRDIESSFIEMPLLLKWKSNRINNYRLYVIGGVKSNIDLASKEDVVDDRVFKIQRNDLMYDIGFGVDIYFEFFKFSPQIVASWGVTDLMVDDDTFFIEGIHRLETRALLLNFTFE